MTQTAFLQVKDNVKITAPTNVLNNTTSPLTIPGIDTTKFPAFTNGFIVTIWNEASYPDPGDDPNMEKAVVTAATINALTGSLTLLRPLAKVHNGHPRIGMLMVAQHISDLDTAVNTAEAAIATNTTAIATETTNRSTAVTNEATARATADTTLQTNITAEATSRASADTTLQTNITTEVSRATAAEALKVSIGGDIGGTGASPKIKRTTRFIVAPYGDTRPADYTCANNTNNEVEINQAIVAANALTNGGVVDLLDGSYYIGAAVIPLSNVWLRGQGMYNTRLKATSSLVTGIVDNKNTYDENNPWFNGILSDFELDGSGMLRSRELKGLNSDSLYNCKIMRLYVHNTTATGIGPDDFYGSSITECIVTNCGFMNNVAITSASWAANVFMFGTASAHGHVVGDLLVITGMTPERYNGRYKVTSVPDSTHFTIDGTNNAGSLTITVDPGTATVFGQISDSLIGHNGIGIASGASYNEATIISNNFCFGNQNNNYLIEADNSNTSENASYIYSNNVSVNAGQVGFLNTGTPNVQFTNNYDYGSPYGIQVAAVSQNRTITAASWLAGVASFSLNADHSYVIGQKVTVTNMTPAAYNGVYIVLSIPTTASYTAALVADPGTATVLGTSSKIAHSTDNTLIQHNILTNNLLYGIRIVSLAESYNIANNTVKNCYNYGIFIGAGYGNIVNNLIYGCGRDGLDIETGSGAYNPLTKVNITNNHIYNNARYVANYDGIEIQASTTAPITDISISNNQIYDNQATKTQRYGVILRSGGTLANFSITNNNFAGNGTGPLLLQNTSETIAVVNNIGVNPYSKADLGNVTGSVTFDSTQANYFSATLTGNITAVMPVNAVRGAMMTWVLTQDATGSRTLSLPVNSLSAGTGQGLVLSTGAGLVDIVTWVYDGVKWRETSRALATTKITSREGINSIIPVAGNVAGITITQNDTTNNPDAEIVTNAGTGNAFKIVQNGILAASKYGFFLDSSVAQTNAVLAYIRQNSASSTQAALLLDNAGSGAALAVNSGNVSMAGGSNVSLSATTGTKIGTATSQKLAFYNSTPIIQPTGNIITALGNLGLVVSGTISEADVTNLTSDLALKAPLASPTFTGTVTIPTTANATDAAQKAYVDTADALNEKLASKNAANGYAGLDANSLLNVSQLPSGAELIDRMRKRPFIYSDFMSTATNSVDPFTGTAIASGTSNGPNTIVANHPGCVRFRSSTTTLSGYYIGTNSSQINLGGGEVFECIFEIDTLALSTFRLGLHDATTSADAVDGVYLEVASTGVATGKTASNSSRTSTSSTYTVSVSTWYRLKVVVTSTSSVTFYLYNDSGTQLWTDTLTATIPNGVSRELGAGVVAINSGTTAVDLMHLDYMAVTWSTDRVR